MPQKGIAELVACFADVRRAVPSTPASRSSAPDPSRPEWQPPIAEHRLERRGRPARLRRGRRPRRLVPAGVGRGQRVAPGRLRAHPARGRRLRHPERGPPDPRAPRRRRPTASPGCWPTTRPAWPGRSSGCSPTRALRGRGSAPGRAGRHRRVPLGADGARHPRCALRRRGPSSMTEAAEAAAATPAAAVDPPRSVPVPSSSPRPAFLACRLLPPDAPRRPGSPQRRHEAVPLPRPVAADAPGAVPVGHLGGRRGRHPPDHRLPLADGALLPRRPRPRPPRLGHPAAVDRIDPALRRARRPRAVPHPHAPQAPGAARRGARLRPQPLRARPRHGAVGPAVALRRLRLAGVDPRAGAGRRDLALAGGVRAARDHVRLVERHLGLLRPPRRGDLGPLRRPHAGARLGPTTASCCSPERRSSPWSPSSGGWWRTPWGATTGCPSSRSPRPSRRPRRPPPRPRCCAASATGSSTAATATSSGSRGWPRPT